MVWTCANGSRTMHAGAADARRRGRADEGRPMGSMNEPRTEALRRALACCEPKVADELRFLEAWEAAPTYGLGTALRVGQIRRANPALAAAIRAELAGRAGPAKAPSASAPTAAPMS